MGEPVVRGTYKWEAKSGETKDLPYTTAIFLKCENYGGEGGWIRVSPAVPKSGAGWGYNTPGSPNWSKLFCSFRGTQIIDCASKEVAKTFWKGGFTVTEFNIVW